MITNPSKLHAILLSNNCTLTDRIPIDRIPTKIKENLIEGETKVDLFGLKIDNHLSFNSHISAICKKAAKQLNALKSLNSFLNISQPKVLAQSFITANFNYCPAVWHFCSAKDKHKAENIQERLFALYTQITVHHTVNFWTKWKPALRNLDGFILYATRFTKP